MNKKIFTIIFALLGCLSIVGYYYIPLGNIISGYPSNLIINLKNGNFKNNEILDKINLKIDVPKYKYSYSISESRDNVKILFIGKKISKDFHLKANLIIYKDDNLSLKALKKIAYTRLENCNNVKNKTINNKKYFICENKNYSIAYYNNFKNRSFISFYPYESKSEFESFLTGIKFL